MNLILYDFDNTLVKTDACVIVNHKNGKSSTIHNKDFNAYKHQAGDEYDFSEFEKICHQSTFILNSIHHLYKDLSNYHGRPDYLVGILTARNIAKPIHDFLYYMDIKVEVPVFAVSGAENKFKWLYEKIKTKDNKIKSVTLYDDDSALLTYTDLVCAEAEVEYKGILIS